MIPPTSSKTFKGYCENEFSTYINIKVQNPNVRRIDIVFDIYKPLSIKAATREKRGSGKRIKVTGSTLIPKDWKTFLHVNENKEQLFMMLSEEIICLVAEGKQIVCTKNEDVLTNDSGIAISNLMPCNHGEADTRMLLHTNILAQCGHSKVKIITVHTNILAQCGHSKVKIITVHTNVLAQCGHSKVKIITVHTNILAQCGHSKVKIITVHTNVLAQCGHSKVKIITVHTNVLAQCGHSKVKIITVHTNVLAQCGHSKVKIITVHTNILAQCGHSKVKIITVHTNILAQCGHSKVKIITVHTNVLAQCGHSKVKIITVHTNILAQCGHSKVKIITVHTNILAQCGHSKVKIITVHTNILAQCGHSKVKIITVHTNILAQCGHSKVKIITVHTNVLAQCGHSKVKIITVHTNVLAQCGHSKVKIITVDTNVIILAITLFSSLNIEELWIEFGSGQNRRWYPIHEIVNSIGRQCCEGILFQYAFTGRDSVSSFSRCVKIKAWETWSAYPGATECFIKLSTSIENLSEEDVSILERYVVLLYDRSSTTHSINECRKQLSAKKARLIENIPPTKDALYQHISTAVYQPGFVWRQSLGWHQVLPSPSKWSWKIVNNSYQPIWMKLRRH